ncbi:MAG TPA: hypothetical protein VKV17_14195 [Bryobacteraceae bacterium]|nr:hypothetical protein [Bryobacteraceae bacterium]
MKKRGITQQARQGISRRSWLLAGLGIPLFRATATAVLSVTSDGDNLHVSAPELHFLSGRPLTRLKDGNTVVYLSHLSLLREAGGEPFRETAERITVSYDVWEEKFKVVLAIDHHSAAHLSQAEAETWCLENLAISALGLEPQRPFWLRFDLRTASERDLPVLEGASGISIRGLIEMFSRKAGAGELRWGPVEVGPQRLIDVPRISVRRAHNG